MLHIFHQSLVLSLFFKLVAQGIFSPSYMPLSSILFCFCLSSSLWMFLLPFCSASCVSPCHVSFFPTCFLSSLHFVEPRLKMSFLPPLLAFPKRSFCGARAVVWEPLLCASCSFLFALLLSFSLLFLFPEYLLNTSPLPATDSPVPLCPSTRHQWDSRGFFLCLLLVPVSQHIFIHSVAGKGEVGELVPPPALY